jgi:hypothetical protein
MKEEMEFELHDCGEGDRVDHIVRKNLRQAREYFNACFQGKYVILTRDGKKHRVNLQKRRT